MRVAIVNDMTMAVETLRRVVTGIPDYSVAWVARNGGDAVQQCAKDRPDLILMDFIMPGMDGVEATRNIMARTPCPILVVTATVEGHSAKVLEALGAGALDAVQTPVYTMRGQPGGADRLKLKMDAVRLLVFQDSSNQLRSAKNTTVFSASPRDPLIVIGASAGGPAALAMILRDLPANLSASIVIVQHIDTQFAPSMASWLGEQTTLAVRTARSHDQPEAGVALIASTNDHLIFADPHNLAYAFEPRTSHYRPSVDVFFDSVAAQWKGPVMGILLTGMGRDGAKGLKALRDAGAFTIAQDANSCVVYGMPKAAAEMGAAVEILPLDRIASTLVSFVKSKKPKICSL